jgi:small-conductance mechanosensitive channel/CRP-like cAMP-binding protein
MTAPAVGRGFFFVPSPPPTNNDERDPRRTLLIAVLALLLGTTLALRRVIINRHVRGRLFASGLAFAAALAVRALLRYAPLSPELRQQLGLIEPLLIAFGFIIAFVALVINPWRANRLPDRFPTIVQDVMAITLLASAAVIILQDKILATTAVGAVVIGFALQDTLGNLFAGLAIQVEKPFRVGHWVNLAGKDGLVSEITWRATKIRTKTGNFVIVPNSALARDTITNYSEPTADTRIDVDVGASYASPPNEVKAAIVEAVKGEPLLVAGRPPEVLIADFAPSAITYRTRVWIADFSADDRVRDRVRSSIYYAFHRHGIEIPYPTHVQIARRPATDSRAETAERALRAVEMFAALSDEQHTDLARVAQSRLYAADEAIVREGEAGSSMFVVTRGHVVVTVGAPGHEVARHGPGSFFGEMSLLTGAPRTATVTAVADCEMLEITAEAFRRVVLANPEAAEHVGAAVATRALELARVPSAGSSATNIAEPPATLIDRMKRFLHLS